MSDNKDYAWKYQLKIRYNMTPEDWAAMLASQGGCCAICQKPQVQEPIRFATDHCHTNGNVRGLLCKRCNLSLGWYEEFKVRVQEYLNERLADGIRQKCMFELYEEIHEESGLHEVRG